MRIGIIGLGNLGSSLGSMILAQPESVIQTYIRSPGSRRDWIERWADRIELVDSNLSIAGADAILLCPKPKQIEAVCEEIASSVNPRTPIISTAAMISLSTLESWLPRSQCVIRAMPNLPCEIGAGVVPYWSHNLEAESVMRSVFAPNSIVPMDSDADLNTATIISGCSPAFFAWMGLILESTNNSNLPPATIQHLIARTMMGTGQLLESNSMSNLISRVASPGGATETALKSMTSAPIQSAFQCALDRISGNQ